MIYELAVSTTLRLPMAVYDGQFVDYGFIDDLREFISLRLDKVDPYRESKEYCLQQEKATQNQYYR